MDEGLDQCLDHGGGTTRDCFRNGTPELLQLGIFGDSPVLTCQQPPEFVGTPPELSYLVRECLYPWPAGALRQRTRFEGGQVTIDALFCFRGITGHGSKLGTQMLVALLPVPRHLLHCTGDEVTVGEHLQQSVEDRCL
ncbi:MULTISPECIES: hypothetical protein [unclassified Streptomyces]|uniref:hypothetical protein n=1 Tax=unclassified Streptomyces TaxID=2593676 RepID=UPI002E0E805E|nr:hypothetical protein OG533_12625 [Streptomyces sp. NBC_01186]WSS41447.1 hypothetical protein OG220_13165 [Streptomyces sp. NBC_01187]